MLVRELAHAIEVAGIDCRDDDLGDSCGSRPGDDGVAIDVELGGIEMAMRVDPYRRADGRPEGVGGAFGGQRTKKAGRQHAAPMMPADRRRPAL